MTVAPRRALLLGGLVALLLAGVLLSLLIGTAPIAPARLIAALMGGGDRTASVILFELRLPRTLLGLLVGGILGLAGAALQGFLRNPLAEPSVLGVSNAASLGAVVAIYYGVAAVHPLALPLIAIAASIAALALLFALAGRGESALSLILAGLALSSLAGAGVSLALNLSPNPFAAVEIMNWLLGSLENRSALHLWLALPCVAAGALLLAWDARALDALSLGEEGARALGFDLGHVRARMLLGTAVGVGGAVAVSGAIGFVGLIVPHMLRPLTDRRPSALLVPAALGGAAFLLLADVAVRAIPSTVELRLGVVTACCGVPLFIAQLLRARRLW